MPTCSSINCKNRPGDGVRSYNKFPFSRRSVLVQWVYHMRIQSFKPSQNHVLCSDHFEASCYETRGKVRLLKKDAIPTIFDIPPRQQKEVKERKAPHPRSPPQEDTNTTVDISDASPHKSPLILPHTSRDTSPVNSHDTSHDTSPATLHNISHDTSHDTSPEQNTHIANDHMYHTSQSPRQIKRQLNDAMSHMESSHKRLKISHQTNRRLFRKVNSLSDVIQSLTDEKLVSDDCAKMLKNACADAPAELVTRMLNNTQNGHVTRETYPPALRAFALTLQFYSSKAYNYARKTFGLSLPHPSTLRKWYSSIDGKPGFTQESFDALSRKVNEAKSTGNDVICSLMLDEMSIRKFVQFDGKQFTGYVDIGTGADQDDTTPLATDALVFMAVAVNGSWKIPVAYFLVHGMSGSERANLIKQCLFKMHDVGVKVISLTCDGPSCHFSMCESLGAKLKLPDIKPYFEHPADTKQQVAIILDICHMLKLVRNNFAATKILKDSTGALIKWSYLIELHELQEREGLLAGNKLKSAHMKWQKQKMKVNLAAQTLSSSVADALEFCRDELKMETFKDCAATVKFIRTFDRLFDVMNSRSPFGRYTKAPMKPSNECHWRPFLSEAYEYVAGLTDVSGLLLTNTRKKTPFVGFLIGIKSVTMLYDSLVACPEAPLRYLLTYKLSQDHLELFFGAVRSAGGSNNNPTAAQFRATYKRLLIRHEIKASTGNCEMMDSTSILHTTHSNVMTPSSVSQQDTLLIRKYHLDTLEPMDGEYDNLDLPDIYDISMISLSEYKHAVIPYIGGYVVRVVLKRTSCPECRAVLITGEQQEANLLSRKDRGGLMKPSVDVIRICETTESCTQRLLKCNEGRLPQAKGIASAMTTAVLTELAFSNIFDELTQHMLDTGPEANHVYTLIKLVTTSYIKIQFHKLARDHTNNVNGDKIRKKLSKLILFNNQ